MSDEDGWDDLNFGQRTASNRGFGSQQPADKRFAAKTKPEDDFDLVDDILDNLTKEEPENKKRPKTAGVFGDGFGKNNDLWSAGGAQTKPAAGRAQ